MTKGFLNSNPYLGKCSSSIEILRDQHENLLSSYIDRQSKVQYKNHSRVFVSLITKFKQDVLDECDPNLWMSVI